MHLQVIIKLSCLKTKNLQVKKTLNNSKISILLILLYSILISNYSYSQIGTIEQNNKIKFQDLFFEALTQKAIRNYDNAISKLEQCNNLLPKNKAVLFELSKNYLATNKLPEALIFAKQALEQENKNIWILEHSVKIYKQQHDYPKAIETQTEITELNPKKKSKLVYLHILNKDEESAKKVIKELEQSKNLNSNLRTIQERLEMKSRSKENINIKNHTKKLDIEEIFNKNQTFENFKKLIKELDKNKSKKILKYSEKGLALFPAQPITYLINAKALIQNNKHKKAIQRLENGLNFMIDDSKTQKEFYNIFVKAYKYLGDNKNMKKYHEKLKSKNL